MENKTKHTPRTDRDYLRQVVMKPFREDIGYCLRTWEAKDVQGRPTRYQTGQWKVAYVLVDPSGRVIFTGNDYGCAPGHAIDSDDCLRGLMGFLTLKPGDTDSEYFDKYTPDQLDFANTDAETLQIWSMESDSEHEAYPFENIDEWEG